MDGFIGEIRAFCFNYTPQGWLVCNGAVVPINQYQALYTIIGSTYGASTDTTFTLPDLRNLTPMQAGTPAAALAYTAGSIPLGKKLGSSTVALDETNLPNHTHQVNGASSANGAGTVNTPTSSSLLSRPMSGAAAYWSYMNQETPDTFMNPNMIQPFGGAASHSNVQPYTGVNYCICVDGQYPVSNQ